MVGVLFLQILEGMLNIILMIHHRLSLFPRDFHLRAETLADNKYVGEPLEESCTARSA